MISKHFRLFSLCIVLLLLTGCASTAQTELFAMDTVITMELRGPDAAEALSRGVTPDAVMTEVEEAAEILGEITGEHASEDILSAIFSRFCVGK